MFVSTANIVVNAESKDVTKDALSITYEQVKNEKALMTEKQKDVLRALGMSDNEVAKATNEDVSNILMNGKVKKPEYLTKYFDKEKIKKDKEYRKALEISYLSGLGFNSDEIEKIRSIELIDVFSIKESDKAALKETINQSQNNTMTLSVVSPMSTGYCTWTHDNCIIWFHDTELNTLLDNDSTLAFHVYAFSSDSIYPGADIDSMYGEAQNWDATAANYAGALYGDRTGAKWDNYLYAEYDNTYLVHRGVDTNKGSGTPLYSITNGQIVRKESGRINIYYSNFNVTMVYMHLNPAYNEYTDLYDTISTGMWIGDESSVNAGGRVHTHIEFHSGDYRGTGEASDIYMPTTALSPYNYFMYFC